MHKSGFNRIGSLIRAVKGGWYWVGWWGLALAIGWGWHGVQRNTQQLREQIAAIAVREERIGTQVRTLEEQNYQIQSYSQTLQKELRQLQATYARDISWRVGIVEQLVQTAVIALSSSGDIQLAVTLLQAARPYLQDPRLASISAALQRDIAALQLVKSVDPANWIPKLDAIKQKTNTLPSVAPRVAAVSEPSNNVDQPSVDKWWQKILVRSLGALKELVVIRHQTTPVLLSPDQLEVVRLQIQTQLATAELALMQRQGVVYQGALRRVIELLEGYYSANREEVEPLVVQLRQLAELEVKPAIPLLETPSLINSFDSKVLRAQDGSNDANVSNVQPPIAESQIKLI